jgi:hypothetical protein
MGAKPKPGPDVSHLNALIPTELHRRLLIRKVNSGKTVQELVAEALELLLRQDDAKPRAPAARKQGQG